MSSDNASEMPNNRDKLHASVSIKRSNSQDTSISVATATSARQGVSAKSKAKAPGSGTGKAKFQSQRGATEHLTDHNTERNKQLRSAVSASSLAVTGDGDRQGTTSHKEVQGSIKSTSPNPIRTEPSAAMKKQMEDAANKPKFVSRRPVTFFSRFEEPDKTKAKKLKATRSMPLTSSDIKWRAGGNVAKAQENEWESAATDYGSIMSGMSPPLCAGYGASPTASAASERGAASHDGDRQGTTSHKQVQGSVKSTSANPIRTQPSAAMKKKMEDAANKPKFVSRRPVTFFSRFQEPDKTKAKKLKATRSMPLTSSDIKRRAGDDVAKDDPRLTVGDDAPEENESEVTATDDDSIVSGIGPPLYAGCGSSPTASEQGDKPREMVISDDVGRDIIEALNEMKLQLSMLEDQAAPRSYDKAEKSTSVVGLAQTADALPSMHSPRSNGEPINVGGELRNLVSKSNKLEQLTDQGKCALGEKSVVAPQVVSPVDMAELLAALANVRMHLTDAKNSAVQLELKRKHAVQEQALSSISAADDDSITSEGTTQLKAHKEKYKTLWKRVKEDYLELQSKYEHVKEDRDKFMFQNEKLRRELNETRRELKRLQNEKLDAGLAADVAAVEKGGGIRAVRHRDRDDIPDEDASISLPSESKSVLSAKNLVVLSGAIEAFQAEYGVQMERMPTGKYEVAGKRVSVRLVDGKLVARRSGKYVSLRDYIFPDGTSKAES